MVHPTGPEYHSVPTWRVAVYRATLRRGHHRGTARRRSVRACRLRRVAGLPRGPQGRLHRRTGRRRHQRISRAGPLGRRDRPPVHAGCRRALLAQRDLDRSQGCPQGRLARRLHGPREWLAESLPEFALSDHAGWLRPQSDRRRRRLPAPVLRRGIGRLRGEAGEERRRAPQPPVLRERQLGAGAAGGHPRRRQAARRQLRRGLHPGRCVGGHRRGVVEPVVLRARHPRRRPVDPVGVAQEPERERAPDRLREPAQPGLRRADGSGQRDLGLRAIDRHEERAGAEGCPGRRRRIGP